MSKLSARLVILGGIIAGNTVEDILADVRDRLEVAKDDAAVKKDINWYRSFAKKEQLIDGETGEATQAGKDWVANDGKKPVSPEVLAKRQEAADKKAAKQKEAAEKKASKSAEKSKKPTAASKTTESGTDTAKTPTKGKSPAKKPAAKKPVQQDDDL